MSRLPWSGTVSEWLRHRLLQKSGLVVDGEHLAENNWYAPFIRLMQNRMWMGYFRYGHIFDPAARRWDNIASAKKRLETYMKTGNLECLVDVANLCMLEFVKGPRGLGSHPDPNWNPVDDGEHTEEME